MCRSDLLWRGPQERGPALGSVSEKSREGPGSSQGSSASSEAGRQRGNACSSIWQHLLTPIPYQSKAAAPARSLDEAQSWPVVHGGAGVWGSPLGQSHGNNKGSTRPSGRRSGKKLWNDTSLMVITKSKQLAFASPSQLALSQEPRLLTKPLSMGAHGSVLLLTFRRQHFRECESLQWATVSA